MFGYGNFERAIAALDELFSLRDYVCGDRFTAADVYVGSQVMFPMQFGMLPERDSFTRYRDRLQARDAYKRATEIDERAMAEAQAASRSRPDANARPGWLVEAQQLGPGAFGRRLVVGLTARHAPAVVRGINFDDRRPLGLREGRLQHIFGLGLLLVIVARDRDHEAGFRLGDAAGAGCSASLVTRPPPWKLPTARILSDRTAAV